MARIAALRIHDPDRLSLRKAVRTALIAPLPLAFGLLVLDDANVALYGLFGAVSMLVFAGFGGPPRERATAYAAATAAGTACIVISTLASSVTPLVVAVTALVGFAVELVAVLGGAVAAARTPLLLAFVLPAVTSAGVDVIPQRVLGWVVGGACALVGALVVWPARPRRQVAVAAAAACRALADLLTAGRPGDEARAVAAVDAMRRAALASVHQPAGPTATDRALASVVAELRWTLPSARAHDVATLDAVPPPLRAPMAELHGATVATLRASAVALDTEAPQRDLDVDVARLGAARASHLAALQRWVSGSLGTVAGEQVVDTLDASRHLRLTATHVLALGGAASTLTGRRRATRAGLVAAAALIGVGRAHSRWGSARLLRSVRTAIALAIGVLVARLSRLDHAFWVVLGVLSVLRTSALGTARSAVEAVVGTLAGFAVATPVLLLLRTDHAALWLILPVTLFLAAYAPDAIGFVVGQAAFTTCIVIAFNLVSPEGWRTGLYRVEDVAVGTAMTVVVAALTWPRGAAGTLRASIVELYERLADALAAGFDGVVRRETSTPEPGAPSTALADAEARAREAFDERLAEPGASAQLVGEWAHALAGAAALRDPIASLHREHDDEYSFGAEGVGGRAVAGAAGSAVARVRALAGELHRPPGPPPTPAPDRGERNRAVARELSTTPAPPVRSVFALAWTSEVVSDVDHVVDHASQPAAELATVVLRPWWRRVR